MFEQIGRHVDDLDLKIQAVERQLLEQHKANEVSQRLATIPGIGLITAITMALSVNPESFESGRHFAAWLGLTPREHSTGGKHRLGRISKAGNERLRQLLEVGAMAVLRFAKPRSKSASAWLLQLLERRPRKVAAVALYLDVTSDASRQAAYTAIDHNFGKLDILINNAAVWLDSQNAATPADRPPSEASEGVVRGTFETNFFAPIFLTQVMLPLLRKSEAGRIVNMSSIRGSLAHLSNPDFLSILSKYSAMMCRRPR